MTGRRLKHVDVSRRYTDKYLLPKMGRFAAADVAPADVAGVIDGLKGRAPTAANDLLRIVRRIFDFGVRRRPLLTKPAADFTPRLDWGDTERARWQELDLEGSSQLGAVWYLPAERTKTGEPLDIPLMPAVVDWFNAMKVISADSEYVFPKRRMDSRDRVPHVGPDTLNVAMARVKHKLPGVEGTYNRHDYHWERRVALGQWVQVLLDAEAGRSNVTSIKRG